MIHLDLKSIQSGIEGGGGVFGVFLFFSYDLVLTNVDTARQKKKNFVKLKNAVLGLAFGQDLFCQLAPSLPTLAAD